MEKFKNKYRIKSARANWWNYGWAGAYFITICTHNREHYFGEINNGKMILSNVGVLADVFWHEIPYRNKNVELGAFVVMPNHIHGILILTQNAMDNDNNVIGNKKVETLQVEIDMLHIETLQAETLHATSPQPEFQIKNEIMSAISPKSGTISSVVRSYKSAITKHANRLGFENGWQSLFHDHIIRDDAAYQKINNYIENNPLNWENDTFFKQEIK